MQQDISPKITLNEEYLDLRKYPETALGVEQSCTGSHKSRRSQERTFRTPNLRSEGLRNEKDTVAPRLINCGLKKLASSYNATADTYQRQKCSSPKRKTRTNKNATFDPRFRRCVHPEEKSPCLKSLSDFSMFVKKTDMEPNNPSAPIFQRQKTLPNDLKIEVVGPVKSKCTMTRNAKGDLGKEEGHILAPKKKYESIHHPQFQAQFKDLKEITDYGAFTTTSQDLIVSHNLDQRLRKKYSVLKMPWKRTWTIPVFSPRSPPYNDINREDSYDRQTYLYDDGTEVDSVYFDEKEKEFFSTAFQNQCMALLFLGGSIFGIVLVSLLIWLIFGDNLLNVFFKPRIPEDGRVKQCLKYICGGCVHIISTFFKMIGSILATPAQNVYHSQPVYYRWPDIPIR